MLQINSYLYNYFNFFDLPSKTPYNLIKNKLQLYHNFTYYIQQTIAYKLRQYLKEWL